MDDLTKTNCMLNLIDPGTYSTDREPTAHYSGTQRAN